MKKIVLFSLIAALIVAICIPTYGAISQLLYREERKAETEPIYILSIGNSYSVDAHTYLSKIAKASGAELVLGNAYIGGCTFRKHLANYNSGATTYTYYENAAKTLSNTDLATIIKRYEWDYITFQLGTEGLSYHLPNTPYLNQLMNIMNELQPQAELVYNLSWVDGSNSTRSVFSKEFGKDREAYWTFLVDRAKEAYNELGIRYVTPGGLAYQYAYETYGDALHRDGYHMSVMGRYLQACVWFEFFTGLSVSEDYLPTTSNTNTYGAEPTAEQCAVLRECAHRAVETLKKAGGSTPSLLVPEWSVDGLQIVGEVKTSYKVGETFDYTTFEVQSTVGDKAQTVTDFTISITRPLQKDDRSITVSYDGLSIEIPLQVK